MKTLTPGFSSPKRKAERARAGLTSEDGVDGKVHGCSVKCYTDRYLRNEDFNTGIFIPQEKGGESESWAHL